MSANLTSVFMSTEVIKYYRKVLDELITKIEIDNNGILKILPDNNNEYKACLRADQYGKKVHFNLLEARMQLGNLFSVVSEEENPYKQATIDRLTGKNNKIPEEVHQNNGTFTIPNFDSKVKLVDYIRELLEEMKTNLLNFKSNNREAEIHLDQCINDVQIAKNYCGKILGCIRDLDRYETS